MAACPAGTPWRCTPPAHACCVLTLSRTLPVRSLEVDIKGAEGKPFPVMSGVGGGTGLTVVPAKVALSTAALDHRWSVTMRSAMEVAADVRAVRRVLEEALSLSGLSV